MHARSHTCFHACIHARAHTQHVFASMYSCTHPCVQHGYRPTRMHPHRRRTRTHAHMRNHCACTQIRRYADTHIRRYTDTHAHKGVKDSFGDLHASPHSYMPARHVDGHAASIMHSCACTCTYTASIRRCTGEGYVQRASAPTHCRAHAPMRISIHIYAHIHTHICECLARCVGLAHKHSHSPHARHAVMLMRMRAHRRAYMQI
jgi:hypothetical protein